MPENCATEEYPAEFISGYRLMEFMELPVHPDTDNLPELRLRRLQSDGTSFASSRCNCQLVLTISLIAFLVCDTLHDDFETIPKILGA